jgi:hypothetical protein
MLDENKMIIGSYYHRNIEFEWLFGDSEEHYNRNLKNPEKHKLLKNLDWLDTKISYKFNNYGFRTRDITHDLKNSDVLMAFGCSHTFGEGIHESNRFSNILAEQLNLTCLNMGVCGASFDTVFRLASHWIPYIKPKIVIILEPDPARKEIIKPLNIYNNSKEPINLLMHKFTKEALSTYPELKVELEGYKKFYDDWVLNEENTYYATLKNRYAIELICMQNNVKLYYLTVIDTIFNENNVIWSDARPSLGRDLLHPGKEVNKTLADMFYEKIKNS